MYCTHCGTEIPSNVNFCHTCGAETVYGAAARRAAGPNAPPAQLTRINAGKKIAGVCTGLAAYLNLDITLVRLLVIVLTVASAGIGIIAYIAAWIVMPADPGTAVYRHDPGTPPVAPPV